MPLNDSYPLAVTFIVGPRRNKDGSLSEVPIGTGFVVRLASQTVRGLGFEYIVTAAHVVEGQSGTAVRFRKQDGGVQDLTVSEWTFHSSADVAATPLRGHDGYGLHLLHVPTELFVSSESMADWRPVLGDRLYFIGLFDLHKRMGERNVPLVRSGTIGALYEQDVPIERPDGAIAFVEAHLVDVRSYAGFSGSPCFVQKPPTKLPVPGVDDPRGLVYEPTPLLGIVSGHFDMWKRAKLTGDMVGSVEAAVNTGVGVVAPAEKIMEVLAMTDLSEERERIEKEHRDSEKTGATLDQVDESEFERFEDLMRKLVNTPKPEKQEQKESDG